MEGGRVSLLCREADPTTSFSGRKGISIPVKLHDCRRSLARGYPAPSAPVTAKDRVSYKRRCPGRDPCEIFENNDTFSRVTFLLDLAQEVLL